MTPAHDRLGLLLHPIDRGFSPLEKTQGGGGYLWADPLSGDEGDPVRGSICCLNGLEGHQASLTLVSRPAGGSYLAP